MTTALWLALRFPHWPLDSRTGETADGSWLVVETRGSRCFVVAATADAVACEDCPQKPKQGRNSGACSQDFNIAL